MSPVKRARPTRRHGQTRRWITVAAVLLLVVTLAVVAFFWRPSTNESLNTVQDEPAAFTAFKNHYLELMKNLNSTENKAKITSRLDPSYNQTDLFTWEQSKLTFTQDTAGWFEDPAQILNSGKGICVQWSIVYVSACLALNHPSRLVIATDTTNWNFIHTWAEDYFNGSWVHVDPSDKVWNNPSRYLSWDWGKAIGSDVKIYAFEDGKFEDVTCNYSS
jgi:transglutaminase-like putative cysteine protease